MCALSSAQNKVRNSLLNAGNDSHVLFCFKACVLVPFIALQVLLGPRGWASVCVIRLPSSVSTENYTDIHFLKNHERFDSNIL